MSSPEHSASAQAPSGSLVTLSPGALAPILGLAAAYALTGLQVGVPLGTGIVLGIVGGTASMLVHEFGHVRVARQLDGIRSANVSLIWLGAATKLEGRYRSGGEQARVAIAGPRSSFAFAGALALLNFLPLPPTLEMALLLLAALNIGIGVLNLVPAAPLDGYKLVLGLLWSATGSEQRALRLIRRLGRGTMYATPPAIAALISVKPGLGLAVAAMTLTLIAQRRLAQKPKR